MKNVKHRPPPSLPEALSVSQLPAIIPRPIAARFIPVTTRTLRRYERQGLLVPIRRNARVIGYEKQAFLKFVFVK
jgi:hypothetical protein